MKNLQLLFLCTLITLIGPLRSPVYGREVAFLAFLDSTARSSPASTWGKTGTPKLTHSWVGGAPHLGLSGQPRPDSEWRLFASLPFGWESVRGTQSPFRQPRLQTEWLGRIGKLTSMSWHFALGFSAPILSQLREQGHTGGFWALTECRWLRAQPWGWALGVAAGSRFRPSAISGSIEGYRDFYDGVLRIGTRLRATAIFVSALERIPSVEVEPFLALSANRLTSAILSIPWDLARPHLGPAFELRWIFGIF